MGRLGDHLGDEVGRLDLDAQAADVAVRAGDVPAGADQPGQVVALLDGAVVDRRAGVAQQQGSGGAVQQRLRDLAVHIGDVTRRRQADMAVRVDQTRDDPAAVDDRLGLGRPGG